MRESIVQRDVWRELSPRSILFRVNTGQAVITGGGKVRWLADGTALVPFARPISLGFQMMSGKSLTGTADLIGWTSVEITADMVGKRVAVFTAVETKESGGGHHRAEQKRFIENVRAAGGIAGFAKSVDEAHAIVNNYTQVET